MNFTHIKKTHVALVILLFYSVSKAQETILKNGIKGIWVEKGYRNWQDDLGKAQWIWTDEKTDILLARKNFILDKKSNNTVLSISASSKYELYLNGKYIAQGPARSAPHHQSYDIFDISKMVAIGKNTIAVRVHHQQNKYSYNHQGRAGLICQLNTNQKYLLATDKTWKVNLETSWDSNAPLMGRFQMVVNDRVNMRKKIAGWNQIKFDDRNWKNALPLLRNSGWPAPKKNEKASALTNPWISLVPREIPYLTESDIKAIDLIEAVTFENNSKNPLVSNKYTLTGKIEKNIKKQLKDYSKKGKEIYLAPTDKNKTTLLIFDLGKVRNGMPQLSISGAPNTKVEILAAPFVVDNTFTHKIVDSEYRDIITLSGKEDNWQSMYFKPTRYLAFVIKGNQEAVKIKNIGIHEISYPYKNIGTIETPQAKWIEEFWEATKKTLNATTTDAMTDNYRERRQYAQTGYYAALGNYWTYGDFSLQKRYLKMVAEEQFANGIMPAYAPLAVGDYMVILDSNCLWIRSLYNYLLYSGDYKTVKELLPAAKKLMTLLHSFTNETGLIYNPPYSYWLDHTLNDRTGANFCFNGHYLGALEDFTQILKWCIDADASKYRKRALEARKSLASLFWNPKKEYFVDAYTDEKQSNQFSEHANAMALAMGIASKNQAAKIAEKILANDTHNFIKRADGTTMVSPAMSYFLHLGLAENGFVNESLELYKNRFSKMLDSKTNGTLWEEWWRDGSGRTGKFIGGRTRSDAQTESAFPTDLFAKYILGLRVTAPGMKTFTLEKPQNPLTDAKATIPTPYGKMNIAWSHKKGKLSLSIPAEVKVILKSRSLNSEKITVDKIHNSDDEIILKAGNHLIEF